MKRRPNIKPLSYTTESTNDEELGWHLITIHAISSPVLHIDQKVDYALFDILYRSKTLKQIILHFANHFPYPIRISTIINRLNLLTSTHHFNKSNNLYTKNTLSQFMSHYENKE